MFEDTPQSRVTVILDGVLLSDSQLLRLPVLATMASDVFGSSQSTVNISVPFGMSGESVIEYASCEDACDFTLSRFPALAATTRLTLEWCGVDTAEMCTVAELRNRLKESEEKSESCKRHD